ncbi:hypothetical protein GX51_07756 [Blastomyces parvus]|uniref:Uncharacterized protein n=1 Tax=Blastomyces parvus TaxID=2060905 RepID=A0A2B7WIZ3_9EURO|nr:hypothetical protein GX51_07756 [Blastomyces parvus]
MNRAAACKSPSPNWGFGIRILRSPCPDCLAEGGWQQIALGIWRQGTHWWNVMGGMNALIGVYVYQFSHLSERS